MVGWVGMKQPVAKEKIRKMGGEKSYILKYGTESEKKKRMNRQKRAVQERGSG